MKTFYKISYPDITWDGHRKVFFADNYERAKRFYDERMKELETSGYDVKSIVFEVKRLEEA